MFRLSSWKPRHLLLAWLVWWCTLIVVAVAPAVPAVLKLAKPGAKGSASVSFGDQALLLNLTVDSVTAWSRTIPVWLISLLVAVPPLVLWALWLRSQRGRDATERVGG